MQSHLRIAIVVHGRFHAFDMVRELEKLDGVTVILLTNYPKRIVKRFGILHARQYNFVAHGILVRAAALGGRRAQGPVLEPFLHRLFGRWVLRALNHEEPVQVIHAFSGVAEEIFCGYKGTNCLFTLIRGSAHIQTQYDILVEEQRRAFTELELPSNWMIKREQREYILADYIFTLSKFAYKSFCDHAIPRAKLIYMPLGTDTGRFVGSTHVIKARLSRVMGGERLRIITVGTFSYQKGALDMFSVARRLKDSFTFRFVGGIGQDCVGLQSAAARHIEFIPRVPQFALPAFYEWADIFFFPTLQDGFAVVLAQAQAAGLPIITTTNCAGPDLIENGKNGWACAPGDADSYVNLLKACDRDRALVAKMINATITSHRPRDWGAVASDFVNTLRSHITPHINK